LLHLLRPQSQAEITADTCGYPSLEASIMGLGVGILLVAAGAVLAFALHVDPTGGGLDLHTIGWILMGVGALGIVLSMLFWSSWAGPGRFSRRTTNVGPTGDTSTQTVDQRSS
jgi:hypothetical protein